MRPGLELPGAALLLSVLVSGCVSAPPRDAMPAPPPPVAVPSDARLAPPADVGDLEQPSVRPDGIDADDTPVRLTLDAVIVGALVRSPALEVVRLDPRIAATSIPEQLSLFDPYLSAEAFWEDSTQQLTAVQSFTFRDNGDGGGGDDDPQRPLFLAREGLTASAAVSTRLSLGTELSLSGTLDRSDTNFTPREYEGAWTFQVVQPLLEGLGADVNLAAVRRADAGAVQAEWALRAAVVDVVAQVEQVYWELALAQETVDIRSFGVQLAEEQLELNRDLVDVGRAVRSAVLAAQAELASRTADLADARGRVRQLSVTLSRLTGRDQLPSGSLVAVIDEPRAERNLVDVDEAVRRALQRRPELQRDRLEVSSRRLDALVARDALRPDLDLVAAYGRTSLGLELSDGLDHLADDSPYDVVRLGLRLGLPLAGRGDDARHERARLLEDRAVATLDETAGIVVEQVRAAAIDVDTQWLRIQAAEEAVAAREEELRIEQDRYEVGMARNLDVLETQRLLIQARVDAVTARVRYLQALTELARAEGTLLERRGVVVDEG